LWIGDRTRQTDSAHVEFMRGVRNPIAVKLGPSASPEEVVELCARLDPDRVPGRLMLISRMGVDRVEELLPPLLGRCARPAIPWSGSATPCTATHS
jgi:3-deoxy-D-arabino-heptulosonate 7-phosphate (DAHP) synthase